MRRSLGINRVSYNTAKVLLRKFKSRNCGIKHEPYSGRIIEINCALLKQMNDRDKNVSRRNCELEASRLPKDINSLKCSKKHRFNV